MISKHELVIEGTIVDKDSTYESRIGIDNGIITEISPDAIGATFISMEKKLIFPGFIDTHVHPRIPGGEHKEDFYHLSRACLHGGATTALCMLNTNPPGITPEVLQYVRKKASEESLMDMFFFGLVMKDNQSMLNMIADYSIGYKIYLGLTTDGFILPIEYLQDSLNEIHALGKPSTIHCDANRVIDALEHMKPFHKVNIAHIPTAEDLNAVKDYKKKGYNVYGEVTPHHLLLTNEHEKRIGNYAKVLPPLQTNEDRLALIEGLEKGFIDFIGTDHAPHTKEEKESDKPPSGMPGDDTLGSVVASLIKDYGISPERIMKVTSYNASEFFGLRDRGRIEVGRRADIIAIDINKPETIDRSRLYTKCGWSPFEGWTFPGGVTHRIYGGTPILI